MKQRLSFTLAFCLGATAFACGDDDSDSPDTLDAAVTTDTASDSDESDTEETETTDTDETATEGTSTDTDETATEGTSTETEGTSTEGTSTETEGTSTEGTSTETEGTSTETEGTETDTGGGTDLDSGVDGGSSGFSITSPNFNDEDPLPEVYTCEGKEFGAGYSPELDWSGAPEGTLSYAVVFKDLSLLPDAPQFAYHWAAWNIPASVLGIPEHLSSGQFPTELEGGEQFRAGPPHDNEFFGPCPSWSTLCNDDPRVTDHYSITLYAFDASELTPPAPEEGVNYASVLDIYFEEMAVASTELNATSDAVPSSAPMCPVELDGGVDAGLDGSTGPTDAATDAGSSDASTDAAADAG